MTGALMARKIAVEILKQINSKEVLVYVIYVIGKPEPLQVSIKVDDNDIIVSQSIKDRFIPKNIVEELDLKKPQYKELSK
jgi:S-adenosylmethionine synthetase